MDNGRTVKQNKQKGKIAYIPLDPVDNYVYIAYLNTRLRVGWKKYLTKFLN